MRAFLYRCPTAGFQVAAYLGEEVGRWDCVATTCYVFFHIHLVNLATGAVLGEDERDALTPVGTALRPGGELSDRSLDGARPVRCANETDEGRWPSLKAINLPSGDAPPLTEFMPTLTHEPNMG